MARITLSDIPIAVLVHILKTVISFGILPKILG
jgi:hypothetical protein